MELENLVKLIQTVSDSDLTGFQYEENGVKLKIQKEKEQMVVSTGAAQLTTVQNVPGAQSNAVSALKSEDGPEKGKEAESGKGENSHGEVERWRSKKRPQP